MPQFLVVDDDPSVMIADCTIAVLPVIFITADEKLAEHAEALGSECLRKPFFKKQLLEAVSRSLPGERLETKERLAVETGDLPRAATA